MFRWCSYCQRFMGQREPLSDYSLTHGICPSCKTTTLAGEEGSIEGISPIIDYFELLRETVNLGDYSDINKLVDSAKRLSIKPADLLVGIIQPLLYDIGRRYEKGELLVMQEHLFSKFTDKLINELLRNYELDGPELNSESQVLLFSAEGDYHYLGLRFLEVLLKQEGIAVNAIYPSLPVQEMYKFALEKRPKVIGISVALPELFDSLVTSLEVFKNWNDSPPPQIIIGGHGVDKSKRLPVDFAVVHDDGVDSLLEKIKHALNS